MDNKYSRTKKEAEGSEEAVQKKGVSEGTVDKALDLAFNATREKLREVTVIDKMQGRIFPFVDVINQGIHYCVEVATYRFNRDYYKKVYKKDLPEYPDLLDELLYRIAQWQKSVQGTNLQKITDIALAEMEVRAGEEDEYLKHEPDYSG